MNIKNKIFLTGSITAFIISSVTYLEGTRYIPYYDIANVLTVCQGYTGKEIIRNKKYTKEECNNFLDKELRIHSEGMLKCVNVPLTRNQFDAFLLFTYNVGVGAFCSSKSVLGPLNRGEYTKACDGLLKWVYADGKYSKGLHNRRIFERKICLGEVDVSS